MHLREQSTINVLLVSGYTTKPTENGKTLARYFFQVVIMSSTTSHYLVVSKGLETIFLCKVRWYSLRVIYELLSELEQCLPALIS